MRPTHASVELAERDGDVAHGRIELVWLLDAHDRLVDLTQGGVEAGHLREPLFRPFACRDVSGETRGSDDRAVFIADGVEEALVPGVLGVAVDTHVCVRFARQGAVVVLLGGDAVVLHR